jgi:hypothetical protein
MFEHYASDSAYSRGKAEAEIDGVDSGCNHIIVLAVRSALCSISMGAASTCYNLEATPDIMETPRHYSGVYEVSPALAASGT